MYTYDRVALVMLTTLLAQGLFILFSQFTHESKNNQHSKP